MLFKRTRVKRRAAFAGLAAILGLGSTLGVVGGVLASGPAGAVGPTTTCTTVGIGVSLRSTIYKVTTTSVKATSTTIARKGDKIIYTVKVGIPAGGCHPFTTGTVKLTLPNGVVKTLATGVTLTPTVATDTHKTFALTPATAYVVTTANSTTHTTTGVITRGVLAH